MRSIARSSAALALAGLLLAACGAAATPTPAPTPTIAPVATPTLAPTTAPAPSARPTATPAPATAGPPDQGVHVTGTEVVIALTSGGTTETVGGVVQVRGIVATTEDSMSDPRVSGTGTIGGNYDRWVGSATQWGTYLLENDGGSWEGTWAGIAYGPPGGPPIEDASVWLVGAGGYAGLSYYFHFHGSNGTYAIDGLVFPGSPPAP